ncbi:hypothetical protein PAPHI01_0583 [Pancytospora philotis]|nr:hypothetical protein PAPHI01_0583 [Pancytospora philotis]
MDRIRACIEAQDHEGVLAVCDERFNKHRAVAAIQLGRYDTALELVEKGTFEHAYVLYSLRRFKKALSVLKRLSGEGCTVLTAQCLYNLGYYARAHKLLSSVGRAEEFAVNLAAMEAMAQLSESGRFRPSYMAPRYSGSIETPISKPSFKDRACAAEFEYNTAYCHAADSEGFSEQLHKLDGKYSGGCEAVAKQLRNLGGADIPSPTKREREITLLNEGKQDCLSTPVHFMKNFVRGSQENELLKFVSNWGRSRAELRAFYKSLKPATELAALVKCLAYLKSEPKEIRADYVQRILKDCGDCTEKDIVLLYAAGLDTHEKEQRAMEYL